MDIRATEEQTAGGWKSRESVQTGTSWRAETKLWLVAWSLLPHVPWTSFSVSVCLLTGIYKGFKLFLRT